MKSELRAGVRITAAVVGVAGVAALMLGGGAGVVVAQEGGKADATVAPSAAAPAAAGGKVDGRFADAEALLSALESADADLRTLTAAIQYVRAFPEDQGSGSHTRRGTMAFANLDAGGAGVGGAGGGEKTATPRRRFAVTFDKLIINGNRLIEERQDFVFDGSWLLELDFAGKQAIRRRVVAEGSGADPLRIGEGPLPLPIGQRKADVLGRFGVSLVAATEGLPEGEQFAALRTLLASAHQIRLEPRAGSEQARDFREIRLWYREPDLLPVFSQAVRTDGSRDEILLAPATLVKNGTVLPERFVTVPEAVLPEKGAGWNVEVMEFRGGARAPEAKPAEGAEGGGAGGGGATQPR